MGRQASVYEKLPSEQGGAGHKTSFKYNYLGSVQDITYPSGREIAIGSDDAGNTVSVQDVTPGSTGSSYLTNATYNSDASFFTGLLGNGVTSTMVRDNQSRPYEWKASSNALGTFVDYFYDFRANRVPNELDSEGNGLQASYPSYIYYTYDSLDRLASFTSVSPATTIAQSYTYTASGNLMQYNSNMPAPQPPQAFYGANNKLLPSSTHCGPASTAIGIDSTNPAYDLSGNSLCDGVTQLGTDHEYVYTGTNQLVQVLAQGVPIASYTYSGEGNRVRKDLMGNGISKEYVWNQGRVLSEHSSDGTWTDYIYTNGQKIAKTSSVDTVLHMSGVNTTVNGQSRSSAGSLPLGGTANYVVQPGDVLRFRQWSNNAIGGLQLSFAGNAGSYTSSGLKDTDGQPINNDSEQGQWHYRAVALSGQTPDASGSTITGASIINDVSAPDGAFDLWLADVSIISLDGSVHPIYHEQPNVNFSPSSLYAPTVLNLRGVSEAAPPSLSIPQNETTYYLNNDLGTTQLEIAGAGWPVWQGQFTPFGQELLKQVSSNQYKFTGQERDGESGQDNFTARYYNSAIGRFASPDPSGLSFADLGHPQSLNLFSYVMNNPLTSIDPSGLCHEPDTQSEPGDYGDPTSACQDPPDNSDNNGISGLQIQVTCSFCSKIGGFFSGFTAVRL
jgi:RHS repeat-associated protein